MGSGRTTTVKILGRFPIRSCSCTRRCRYCALVPARINGSNDRPGQCPRSMAVYGLFLGYDAPIFLGRLSGVRGVGITL